MVDVQTLTKEEIEEIEEEREKALGPWICESKSKSPIITELRYNYLYVYLPPYLVGQNYNKFELKVDDEKKHIHLAFIGVAEEQQKKELEPR